MQLLALTADIDGLTVTGDAETDIRGLTADSRAVQPGYLFAALPGLKLDGRTFIGDAIAKGAAAILTTHDVSANAPIIATKNPRRALAQLAAQFYGAQPDTIAAVTVTNGKSSTVDFCRQIWKKAGPHAASMGTIGTVTDAGLRKGSLTTPDPVSLQENVAQLAKEGITHLALEASSQGMHQYRLDGLKIKIAGFTNISRDHLDYHGSMEAYFSAKLYLFTQLLHKDGTAVINADSDAAEKVLAACHGRQTITYGHAGKDIRILSQTPEPAGQYLSLEIFGTPHDVHLPLVGAFQAENALCALGMVLAEQNIAQDKAITALTSLKSVRGRLELAGTINDAAVYVDYAHTPDGLETMLHALRPHTHGKLRVVFGCGGDRDKGKRPMMGEIAVRLADDAIVTDDNPRTENAKAVRADIMTAAKGAREIGERRTAIFEGIKSLEPGDVLVIAGKGHEQGQIIGRDILPFDDVTEAKKAIKEISG